MTKRDEETTQGSTWHKTLDDEPVFILCGRDMLTPDVIRYWANRAEAEGVNPNKVEGARTFAEHVRKWQEANGKRVPD